MEFKVSELRLEEAAELRKLACPNFSVIEQLFLSKPKMGIVARTEDGKIAGAAFLVTAKTAGKMTGCVDIIFVLPQYRGSGVARLLYHGAVKALHEKGCETVMALVRGDNSQSLRRIEAEGLRPVTLYQLCKSIGVKATGLLFVKTAALACATGCWILSDCDEKDLSDGSVYTDRNSYIDRSSCTGGTGRNLLRTFLVNGLLITIGSLLGSFLHVTEFSAGTVFTALLVLGIITTGETIGMCLAGGKWHFAMPEAGLLPSAMIAVLGGFYPMLGHWYLKERENTKQYRKRMASPAIGAWLLMLLTAVLYLVFREKLSFFQHTGDLSFVMLLFYVLPFYPFDTFGAKRIRESSKEIYAALLGVSVIVLGLMFFL